MGYPMTYARVVQRNKLAGDYGTFAGVDSLRSLIAGDLRRLESDTRDAAHLQAYADIVGITPEQVKRIFDIFFDRYDEISDRAAEARIKGQSE